jgi:hypothetical protein
MYPPAGTAAGKTSGATGGSFWKFSIGLGLKLKKFPLLSLKLDWLKLIWFERIFKGFD